MDHTDDWLHATGSWIAGRGGYRPINPKLLPGLKTKARPAKSLARQTRRTILAVHEATLRADRLFSSTASQRRTVRDPGIYEQSQPGKAGAAAQLRHWAAVQRARKF